MFSKEADLLQQIANSREAIRKKHSLLKQGNEEIENNLHRVFTPVLEPLKKIASNVQVDGKKLQMTHSTPINLQQKFASDDDFFATVSGFHTADQSRMDRDSDSADPNVNDGSEGPTDGQSSTITPGVIAEYFNLVDQADYRSDRNYGVRHLANGYFIGSKPFKIVDDKILIDQDECPATNGLLELLFKRKPDENLIREKDGDMYAQYTQKTNLLRKRFLPGTSFKNPTGNQKFSKYLAGLIKEGGSLPKFMTAFKKDRPFDYKYWDDPNELADRLRLLIAERSAGNNNHDNEIQAIIEELREAKIIY